MRIFIIFSQLFLISIAAASIQLLMIFCCDGNHTISILTYGNAYKFIKIISAAQSYLHRWIYLICCLGIQLQIEGASLIRSYVAIIVSTTHQQCTRGFIYTFSAKRDISSVFDSKLFRSLTSILVFIWLFYNPMSGSFINKAAKASILCIQCRIHNRKTTYCKIHITPVIT